MTNEELGPCPLCGGEAATYDGGVFCKTEECSLGYDLFTEPTWNSLSAIAEQNRRLGEALERCRSMRERGEKTGGHACLYSALLLEVEKICEEAMK